MKKQVLRSRIFTVLLVVSLFPLCFVGMGAWVVFGRLLDARSLELQRTVVESHARAIESYLDELLNSLRLLSTTQVSEAFRDSGKLSLLLNSLNQVSGGGFLDLGVIDENGNHLAYVGHYDLLDKNYSQADWFRDVNIKGEYISDVFLGFRQVPHCIVAVRNFDGEHTWILRATIDSDRFDSLVRTGMLGELGDAYIVNKSGVYQTSPRSGSVFDQSPVTSPPFFRGVSDSKVRYNGEDKIRVITWINSNNWLLVVEQDAAEVRAPVTRATMSGALIVALAIIIIVITTYLATRHLNGQIMKANAQREEMVRAFNRSAKLASVGELATGLAHEINNPLAIMSADQTNISDIINDLPAETPGVTGLKDSIERSKRQIQRCKSITTKMLQFGRKREAELKPTDITHSLSEIKNLLQRQADIRNIALNLKTEEYLPKVMIDPLELEQVLVNMIQNSFHALKNGGRIDITAHLGSGGTRDAVILEVNDNGCGISPENLERIFEPFFTTKPVGEGTGLGLSVCYGIVESWGGRLEAFSKTGEGTTMKIHLPVRASSK